ncbi:hypothetical protein PG984_002744 [Apiospora sp. TS-2023a]
MSFPPEFYQLIPPPTEINDAHNDYSFGTATAAMGSIGTLCVFARLAIRYKFRSFGADDCAIIPAVVLFLAWCIMASYLCLNVGVGKPLWEITVAQYEMWLKGQVASMWLYPAMSASIRISVLLFFRRIFGRDRVTNKSILILLGLQGAYIVVFSIVPVFGCGNVAEDLHFYVWASRCSLIYFGNTQTALYTVSLAFDVVLFTLPFYPMFKLQMNKENRVKVLIIFTFGITATVPAAYKLAVSIKEWVHIIPPDDPFHKYQLSYFVPGQYSVYGETFWIPSTLEPTIAIIATSLPAFRHLATKLKERSTSGAKLIPQGNSGASSKRTTSTDWSSLPLRGPHASFPMSESQVQFYNSSQHH